jgi:glycine hydroxymethyltransferase
MHIIAAKAVCFKEALSDEFIRYQQQVVKNAKVLAEELIRYGITLVTNGTDTHLLLVDLTEYNVTGKDVEIAMGKAGIIVNKNTIPYDTRGPMLTSGIRIGTPALTTRGMKEEEMRQIAEWIYKIITSPFDDNMLAKINKEVYALTQRFPLYTDLYK